MNKNDFITRGLRILTAMTLGLVSSTMAPPEEDAL